MFLQTFSSSVLAILAAGIIVSVLNRKVVFAKLAALPKVLFQLRRVRKWVV